MIGPLDNTPQANLVKGVETEHSNGGPSDTSPQTQTVDAKPTLTRNSSKGLGMRGFLDRGAVSRRTKPSVAAASERLGDVNTSTKPGPQPENQQTGTDKQRVQGSSTITSATSGTPPASTADAAALSAPSLSLDTARRAAFQRLQPLCSALLPLRTEPRSLAAALKALQAAVSETEAVGLQACMDYVTFPLLYVVDSIGTHRRERTAGGAFN